MRISNIASIMGTRVSQLGNNVSQKNIKPNINDNRDTVSVSKSAKNAFQKQSKAGSFLDSLLKQKQNIIDNKNSLMERATENGQGLNSIKDQLKYYDAQLTAIDKQITEYMLKEQQKKMGTDKKENKIPDNQPKTEEEASIKQASKIFTYKDIQKSSNDSSEKPQLEILA